MDKRVFNYAIERYLSRTGFSAVNPRAALIDMDGTLYDSMPNHARAWHQMMAEIGVSTDPKEFFIYEGRTGASTIQILFRRELGREPSPDEINSLYHRKTELFSAQPPVSMMPGADRMLSFLEQSGIRRILVTGSGQSSLIDRLKVDYPGAFAPGDMITSRDVKHGKPSPEPYLMAMRIAGVEPWQSVVFENAPLGVQSGVESGAFTIAVTTGPIPRCEFEKAGADIIFDSMQQCADSLPSLFNSFTY